MRFTLIVSLLLAVLAVIFALQNPDQITVNLGPFEIDGSTALILIVTFALGAFVGFLAMIPSKLKSRKTVKSLKKQATSLTESTPPPTNAGAPDFSPETYAPPSESHTDR